MYNSFILLKLNNDMTFLDDFLLGLLGANIRIENSNSYKVVYYNKLEDDEIFEALEALIDELPDLKGVISLEYKDEQSMKSDIEILKNKLDKKLKYPIYNIKDLIYELVLLGDREGLAEIVLKNKLFDETIKSYIEMNMNTSRAAEELYMHRNTIINKIDRFKMETGYDVREFKDAYVVYTFLAGK